MIKLLSFIPAEAEDLTLNLNLLYEYGTFPDEGSY